MVDPANRALTPHRGGQRIGGLLAHLEQIIGHDGRIVVGVGIAGGEVGQKDQLHAHVARLGKGGSRCNRVERQRQDDAGRFGQSGFDVAALLGRVKGGAGRGHNLYAEARKLGGCTGADRVHKIGLVMPEQGRGIATGAHEVGVAVSPCGPTVWARAGRLASTMAAPDTRVLSIGFIGVLLLGCYFQCRSNAS